MTLKALKIKHAGEGMHADGNGLYLRVGPTGGKSWIFRYQLHGKRREMGLGTLAEKSVVEARAEAAELRKIARAGVDPIEARRQGRAAQKEAAHAATARKTTFRDVAEDYIETKRAGWANAKHAAQWASTLETYAYPFIGDLPVAEITTDDVLNILRPLWTTKTETATRVRQRIECVLTAAKVKRLREGENPAAWRGHLQEVLPAPKKLKRVRHHPALPYVRMGAFMRALREVPGFGARALEFAILTAARSGEVRGAKWSEFNLAQKLWVVPASRMKATREHRVPLSPAALMLLKALPRIEGVDYVFPGVKSGKPISDMTLAAVIRRMNEGDDGPAWIDEHGEEIVPHGFRSTFRDWVAEQTNHPRDLAERALAHVLDSKVEAAYQRGDMLDRRRALMNEWAAYCEPKRSTRPKR